MKWGRWLALLCAVIVIVVIVRILWLQRYKEGFIALDFNVDNYQPNEIFLLAPNAPGASNYVDIYIDSMTPSINYTNGYTWDQAKAACEAVGAKLAPTPSSTTPACSSSGLDLNCAAYLGANWCAAGWTETDHVNAYFPACGAGSTPGIGTYTPTDGRAYAICIGPKPPEPTLNVRDFNDTRYSMFDDVKMNALMVGDVTSNGLPVDIFPRSFTRSEAAYALEQNRYNFAAARAYLINQYGIEDAGPGPSFDSDNLPTDPVNKAILAQVDPTYLPPSINSTTDTHVESCAQLTSVYNTFKTQISTLQGLLRDLSGDVLATIDMKEQNNLIQNSIATICENSNLQATPSEACARLASLDFDTLYRNTSTNPALQSNLIVDLETLNLTLYMRQCELIAPLGGLQNIMNVLGCSGYEPIQYGNNLDANGVPFTCATDYSKYPNGIPPSTAFTVGGGKIDQNAVEGLKFSLQQISPYYNSSNYSELIATVLEQLSVLLRTPLITDYTDSNGLFKIIKNEIAIIKSSMPGI
jgi:hypothetical protein